MQDRTASGAYFMLFESTGWNQAYKAEIEELHKGISNIWYTLSTYGDVS